MKAHLTPNGTLVVLPESETEAYALKKWSADAIVLQQDQVRQETCHVRGSMFLADLQFPRVELLGGRR
jgi:hypothetical protein